MAAHFQNVVRIASTISGVRLRVPVVSGSFLFSGLDVVHKESAVLEFCILYEKGFHFRIAGATGFRCRLRGIYGIIIFYYSRMALCVC